MFAAADDDDDVRTLARFTLIVIIIEIKKKMKKKNTFFRCCLVSLTPLIKLLLCVAKTSIKNRRNDGDDEILSFTFFSYELILIHDF